MKKILKITGIALGIIVLLLLSAIIYIQVSGIPHYENLAPELNVVPDSARIAEGTRIALQMCVDCHGSEDGKLGGAYMPDDGTFGKLYSANITNHPEFGITDYTDGELAYLFRTGIRKDGQYVPPWMPKFPHLSDEDMYSIIAFLRSDHPLVQASDNNPPPIKPSFLAKFLSRVAFKPLPYPQGPIEAPPVSDKAAFGKYVATAKFDCYACHSASFKTVDILNPEHSEGYFGGGNKLYDKDLNLVVSANLTMDPETGLGKWTEEEFIRTLKYGMRPDGNPLRYPMIPYALLTNEEVSAIWAYLKTIPVIHNPNDKVQ